MSWKVPDGHGWEGNAGTLLAESFVSSCPDRGRLVPSALGAQQDGVGAAFGYGSSFWLAAAGKIGLGSDFAYPSAVVWGPVTQVDR